MASTSALGRSRNDSSFTNMNTYLPISLTFADRSDLDRVARPRFRERHRGGHVRQFEDAESTDGFLRFDERAIEHRGFSIGLADRRGGPRRLQLRATLSDLFAVGLQPL